MMPTHLELPGEPDMQAFGAALADVIPDGVSLYFHGQLGAGKTTLVRALLRGMGVTGAVKSPTYTLVETYAIADRVVHHFDLYRLSEPEELEYLGIRDFLDGHSICLVEWPEQAHGLLPAADLDLYLEVLPPGRRLDLHPSTDMGRNLLRELLQDFNKNFDKQ